MSRSLHRVIAFRQFANSKMQDEIDHCSAYKSILHAHKVAPRINFEPLGRPGLLNYVMDKNFQVRNDHIIDIRDYPDDLFADIERLGETEALRQRP